MWLHKQKRNLNHCQEIALCNKQTNDLIQMNNRNKKIKVKEEVDSGYLSCVLLSYVTWTRVLVSDMEYGVQVPNSDNIGKFTTILALKKC